MNIALIVIWLIAALLAWALIDEIAHDLGQG